MLVIKTYCRRIYEISCDRNYYQHQKCHSKIKWAKTTFFDGGFSASRKIFRRFCEICGYYCKNSIHVLNLGAWGLLAPSTCVTTAPVLSSPQCVSTISSTARPSHTAVSQSVGYLCACVSRCRLSFFDRTSSTSCCCSV